ncbi:hypothetical protein GOV05_00180 [Candidatus Woesearchaeota archaeon]|nr:hypothetical protein [Candidatus Woesearchaeota archaeon]
MGLERAISSYLDASVGVIPTKNGFEPVVLQAERSEELPKETGNKTIDELTKVGRGFQEDLNQYYDSDFYDDFRKATSDLGYSNINKFEKIEVNKLLRHAAAYVNPVEKRVGVSDQKDANYKQLSREAGINSVAAMYLALSHEHIHADTQNTSTFSKGRLFTELDAEAKLYASLIQMASNNPEKASEYMRMAQGVEKRYEALDKAHSKKTRSPSNLLQRYVSKIRKQLH